MTRAEKFKEVFGLKIDTVNADCGFFDCSDIESCASCPVLYTQSWWDDEYEALSQPQENCDTCKHKDDGWDSEHCDGCCGNHSGYESQERNENEADN